MTRSNLPTLDLAQRIRQRLYFIIKPDEPVILYERRIENNIQIRVIRHRINRLRKLAYQNFLGLLLIIQVSKIPISPFSQRLQL